MDEKTSQEEEPPHTSTTPTTDGGPGEETSMERRNVSPVTSKPLQG